MLAKVDMLLQNTGIKREGFKLVKDPKPQGMVRGSISQEAIDMVKATLAKAKAMGATDSPDPKPIMNPADVTDKDFNETTSAGSIASSMGGGNGFVGGGIGTVKRNNPKKKKRSNKS
jgi:hypothetical protein